MAGPSAAPPEEAARVVRAMSAWRRRSRLIHFYRKALPALIGVVLAGMLGWVTWRTIAAEGWNLKGDAAVVRLVNPRFYGQDPQGRGFVLGAQEAVRPLNGSELIRLIGPLMQLDGGDGAPIELSATRGVYDEGDQTVRLSGRVRLAEPESGFVFTTPEAVVDTREDRITGARPITGTGPLGRVDASSYAITDGGSRLVFRGDGTLDGRARVIVNRGGADGGRTR